MYCNEESSYDIVGTFRRRGIVPAVVTPLEQYIFSLRLEKRLKLTKHLWSLVFKWLPSNNYSKK